MVETDVKPRCRSDPNIEMKNKQKQAEGERFPCLRQKVSVSTSLCEP